jgi:hypothetical protein
MTRSRLTAACCDIALSVSRLFWAANNSCPSACSVGVTLLKHEPSAHNQWANTMLGLDFLDMADSSLGDD